MWIAGGNDHTIRNNHFYDNWRRGTMLFAVPDALDLRPEHTNNHAQKGCDPNKVSTSFRNRVHGERDGARARRQASKPNGTDFWWDDFLGNTGNCWYLNEGPQRDHHLAAPAAQLRRTARTRTRAAASATPPTRASCVTCLAAFETRNFDKLDQHVHLAVLARRSRRRPPRSASSRTVRTGRATARRSSRFCAESPDANTCKAYLNPLAGR